MAVVVPEAGVYPDCGARLRFLVPVNRRARSGVPSIPNTTAESAGERQTGGLLLLLTDTLEPVPVLLGQLVGVLHQGIGGLVAVLLADVHAVLEAPEALGHFVHLRHGCFSLV